jgi:hypothetical protein
MNPLRPDRVRIIPDSNGVKAYLYIPQGARVEQGVTILPDQMIHTKLPNPRDEFEGLGYGLSSMTALAQTADVDNGFTSFIKLLVERGIMPPGILRFNIELTETQAKSAKRRFMDLHGGVENWNDVLVMDNGGDYKQLSMNFRDLDFASIDRRNETRTIGVLGVPIILLETLAGLANSTYANKAEARKQFWEDVMTFELGIFDDEYEYVLNEAGIFVQRDYSQVPALQKNIPELVKAAQILWTMGTPANQAVRAVGIHMDDIPGGDIAYIGGKSREDEEKEQQRADEAAARLAEENDTPKEDEEDDDPDTREDPAEKRLHKDMRRSASTRSTPVSRKEWTVEQKALVWKTLDDLATAHEDDFGDAVETSFKRDKRTLLALVNAASKKAIHQKATINWLSLSPDITAYLTGSSPKGWRETFVPVMGALIEDTGNYWSAELGTTFDVRNVLGEAWFKDYTLQFAKPISQTTSDTIHDILALAQEQGWSSYEMTERLGLVFDQWINGNVSVEDLAWLKERTPPWRREMIARTETCRLQARGNQELFTSWDIQKKEWLATQDNRCRPSHKAADGQQRDMNQPFQVAEYAMMHPGDMSKGAPVSEIVFCRCALLPIVQR